MKRSDMIKALSAASDRRGDLLVDMMDKYGAIRLPDLTDEQVREYYEEWLITSPSALPTLIAQRTYEFGA